MTDPQKIPSQSNGSPARRATNPERAWPLAITAVLIVFVLSILGFIIFASVQNRDLVEAGYYAKGLDHDAQMLREANVAALSAPVMLDISDPRELVITLPDEFHGRDLSGEVHLYRPSSAAWDQRIALEPGPDGQQTVDLSGLPAGMWRVKLNWEAGGDEYYFEDVLVVKK